MIPFSVIGGFLGAGKTTLINRLIRQPLMPRLAILVNDFGDIAVDAALLEAHGGDTIALANGCICCSIGNDLTRALGRVLDGDTPVEHIVVEASGVANPGRIMDVARLSPELQPACTLVVVDAGALVEQLEDRWIADTVAAQLGCADLFLVNKLDTVDAESRAAVQARLARDYRDTRQVDAFEDVWPRLVAFVDGTGTSTEGAREHLPFCSRSLVTERALAPERLRTWLAGRDDVYRVKGWVRFDDDEFHLLQYAGGRMSWTPVETAETGETRLVVIGREGLPAAEEILAAIVAPPDAEGASEDENFGRAGKIRHL